MTRSSTHFPIISITLFYWSSMAMKIKPIQFHFFLSLFAILSESFLICSWMEDKISLENLRKNLSLIALFLNFKRHFMACTYCFSLNAATVVQLMFQTRRFASFSYPQHWSHSQLIKNSLHNIALNCLKQS